MRASFQSRPTWVKFWRERCCSLSADSSSTLFNLPDRLICCVFSSKVQMKAVVSHQVSRSKSCSSLSFNMVFLGFFFLPALSFSVHLLSHLAAHFLLLPSSLAPLCLFEELAPPSVCQLDWTPSKQMWGLLLFFGPFENHLPSLWQGRGGDNWLNQLKRSAYESPRGPHHNSPDPP